MILCVYWLLKHCYKLWRFSNWTVGVHTRQVILSWDHNSRYSWHPLANCVSASTRFDKAILVILDQVLWDEVRHVQRSLKEMDHLQVHPSQVNWADCFHVISDHCTNLHELASISWLVHSVFAFIQYKPIIVYLGYKRGVVLKSFHSG